MADLKPCPFCGSNAHINIFANGWAGYSVSCDAIFGCGATQERFDTEKEAIEAWNRRAERVGKWEAVGKDLICSECKALKCASYPYFNYCPNCGQRMETE